MYLFKQFYYHKLPPITAIAKLNNEVGDLGAKEIHKDFVELREVAKCRYLKGTVHQKIFFRSNLIFLIVMRCGTADLGHRGL